MRRKLGKLAVMIPWYSSIPFLFFTALVLVDKGMYLQSFGCMMGLTVVTAITMRANS